MKKLIKILKHSFIPHKHNNFKPSFFEELSIAILFVVVIVLFSVSAGTKLYINKTDMTAAVLPAVLVDLTNNTRQLSGELALVRNPVLDKVAQLKAEDMSNYGYFAHTSPSGLTPWHWFSEVDYSFSYAGENLAIDFTESLDVENAWIKSPTHKANILNSNFTEIGIATVEGYYNGHPTVYVVQMFAKPIFARNNVDKIIPVIKENEPIIEKKTEDIEVVSNSGVKGESVVLVQELETITDTEDFISVKNISTDQEDIPVINTENKKYSTWSQRFMFLAPSYTDVIYRILIYIILLALILMTVIEIKRQHPKNIMYGVFLIVIIFCLIYINKSIFLVDFLT